MSWVIGVDVGGTFTDFFALHEPSGKILFHKTPSTPANPARAVLDGAVHLCRANGLSEREVARLGHGTTVATNALIQRKGGRVALITTKGFRDVLEIGRQIRPKLYSLQEDFPAPLVPRSRRFELNERVTAKGETLIRPSDAEISDVVKQVVESGAEACAICFLFSFLSPETERRVAAALAAEAPDVQISVSSEVQPEFREYERLSTTVLNAYLLSVMSHYMATLEREFGERFPGASIGVNQSSGGLMSVARARRFPVRTALSGPAAGVVGAVHTAKLSDRKNIITLDMGGTSADVALIRDYHADISFERSIEDFPVRLPSIDINSVGAGGGSIAWFERDGLLKVGPESAGSVPGPACYGRGGERPTVSDANLVLGRLSTEGLLGGAMPLDADAARKAIAPVAERLGFTIERTAHGIITIVANNMVRAIRGITIERGLDPRGFSLLAFGGAGPLHASDVAEGLGIKEIVIPYAPGILCAQGLVVADTTENFVRTVRIKLAAPGALKNITRHLDALLAEADAWSVSDDVPRDAPRSTHVTLDMRYVGQNFELSVPLDSAHQKSLSLEGMRDLFFDIHKRSYGYFNENDPVEVINIRLIARAKYNRPGEVMVESADRTRTRPAKRNVYFNGDEPVESAVYLRSDLKEGDNLEGPAVIEQLDATTVVFPGYQARVDGALNIIIEAPR
jgi:N-methylhydantoinase A